MQMMKIARAVQLRSIKRGHLGGPDLTRNAPLEKIAAPDAAPSDGYNGLILIAARGVGGFAASILAASGYSRVYIWL